MMTLSSASLNKDSKKQKTILINSLIEHPYKLKKGYHIATFFELTPKEAEKIKQVNPAPLRLDTNHGDPIQYAHAFQKIPRSGESNETYRLPTTLTSI